MIEYARGVESAKDLAALKNILSRYIQSASNPSASSITEISSNTTLSDEIILYKGDGYNIEPNITLTINGPFSAPLTQVFYGSGTVVFGADSVTEIYPQWWGFSTSGTAANNVTYFNAAVASMSAGQTLVISPGTYPVTYTVGGTGCVFNPPNYCTLDCRGVLTTSQTGAGVTLTIGSTTANKWHYKVKNLNVISTVEDWTASRIGIRTVNLVCAFISVDKVQLFSKGIETMGMGSLGHVYNQYYLGYLLSCKYALNINVATSGWNNENIYYGGSFSWGSGLASYVAYGILITYDATHNPNNHRFFGPGFESSDATVIPAEIGGENISLYDVRHESVADFTFTVNSRYCTIWGGNHLLSTDITDAGTYNQMFLTNDMLVIKSGSGSTPALRAINSNGDAATTVQVMNLAGSEVVGLRGDGKIHISGTQVISARQSGVSAMTNLTAPANLDADTVTVAQLADIVGNLIAKLQTHGLVEA